LLRQMLPGGQIPSATLAKRLNMSPDTLADYLYEQWNNNREPFFLPTKPSSYPFGAHLAEPCVVADEIINGHLRFFSNTLIDTGNPPDWFQGTESDAHWPRDVHWTQIPDLSSQLGDIKYVWEPARFKQAFALVRAYAATDGNEQYAEAFWLQFENWDAENQTELGPHWRCAQEMSLRCLAWIFALYGFSSAACSTPNRIGKLLAQIWYHATHIDKIHWYATRCIRNNHAVSEATALLTIGSTFPFLPGANQWRQKGLSSLTREISWQIYQDGSYIQHSNNYSRVIAQLLTWVLALARARNESPPAIIAKRAVALHNFLYVQQDPVSGLLPNYGSNDGTLLFPLTDCTYNDFRPALDALNQVLARKPIYDPGPWQEETFWFGGNINTNAPSPLRGGQPAQSHRFDTGGYYVWRGPNSHAVIRCTEYRHRPAQADMLHLDLWYQGHNVLIDPGTYSYSPASGWRSYFVGTASHNTVTIDGRDQMEAGPRFTWRNWTHGRLLSFEQQSHGTVFNGEHSGYNPVIHRRHVRQRGDLYIIVDDLFSEDQSNTEYTFRLHWLLDDLDIEMSSDTALISFTDIDTPPLTMRVACNRSGIIDWQRAETANRRGWQSRHYGERTPAWSCEMVATGTQVRFLTVIGPRSIAADLYDLQPATIPTDLTKWQF